MSDVNANINISINSKQALGQLRALQNQISDFNRSVIASNVAAAQAQKALTSQLAAQVSASKTFSTSITNVESSVSRLDRAIAKNKLSLGQYFRYATAASGTFGRSMKEHGEIMELAADRVKRLQTQYVALGQAQNGMTRAMAMRPLQLHNADAAIGIQRQQLFNKLMHDGSTAMVNWGKNTQWAGRQLMVGFTVPLTIFGGVAGKIFMDLEKQIIAFKRVYGDLQTTPVEKAGMVEQVKALAKEFTKYGIAVNDTIALSAKAAATGATGADLIAQTTEATRLATLGQIDYQQALDATISLQTAFGIASKDLAETTDFLNAVENQTVTSLDDITSAIPLVAPVIKGLGGDVKDLAIFMTAMREGGVSANEGANALKSGLASLINPTKAAREQLQKVGIDIDSILSTNKGDLRGLVTEFGAALGTLDKFERQQTLAKMFGKYQFARLGALFQNISKDGTQASRVIDLTTESAKDLAKLSKGELSQIEEAVGVKFTAAVEKLKVAIAPIGEAFLKIATPIIEFATTLADKFNNLPDGMKSLITWGVAIGGVVIPAIVMIVGLFANFLGQMIKMGNTFRMFMQKVRGGGSALQYLESEELDAMAAAASLEGQTNSLTGALNVQRGAVVSLARAYESYVAGANAAAAALPQGFRGPTRAGRGPRRMATGGFVAGSGNKDTEPALLTPGEFVVNKKAASQNADLLSAMNSGMLKRLAGGTQSSLYGGQEVVLAPHTMLAPGNTAGSFGMDRSFFESGTGFEQSLRASAAASSGVRLTDAVLSEMAQSLKPYTEEIVSALRTTAQEMTDAGEEVTHISQIFEKARPKVEKIVANMEKAGGNVAAAGRGIRTLAYPTDEEMISQGERRVPAARRTSSGRLKFTQFRSKASSSLKKMRNTYGRMFGNVPQGFTAAHVTPENRKLLGGILPFKGGMLQEGLTKEVDQAKKYIEKKSVEIREAMGDPVGDAINGPRHSPHPAVPKAGREDGKAYEQAFVAEASDSRKKASGAKWTPTSGGWLAGGASPYGQNPTSPAPRGSGSGGSSGRFAPGTLPATNNPDLPVDPKAKTTLKQKMQGMSGKLGAGMFAMDGLLFGLSMMDNGVGDFAQKIMPAAFALQGLGMMLPMLTSPIGIAVAALAAVGVTAFLLKKGLDANIEAGRKMADSMSLASKEIEGVAQFFGRKTFASKRKDKKQRELSGLTTKQQQMATEFNQSEVGKSMAEEAKVAMEKSGKGFASTLATQLSQMVVSGAVNKKQAEAMALGISQALGKEEMTAEVVARINSIIGPHGEDLTNQPLKIIANIEASMSKDEANMADRARAEGGWDSSWLSSDNFMGLGWAYSGEYDKMIEDAIAYQQTYIANTTSLLSSIDDEVARQQDLIDKLKEKKKAAKEANDEEKAAKLDKQIGTTQATIDRLNEKRQQTLDQRRTQATNIMLNSPRSESFQAAKVGIEEQYGVTGMDEALKKALAGVGLDPSTSTDTQGMDKMQASILVDVQLGIIDPVALTAMEKMGDDSTQVMKLAMDAYVAGDVEKMNTIMQAYTSLPPSVVTVVKPLVDKMGYDQAASFLSIISMFPPEIATKVAVEMSGMKPEELDKVYESIKNLQDLGIDVSGILAGEGGVKSILELNDALSGIPKTLKKFAKELNAIDKLKSKESKIEKTIQVVTKITDAEGNPTTPENIKAQIKEVADDSGLSVAEVMSLPADVYTKAILMKLQADSLRQQGQSMINAARYLGQVDAAAGSELAKKGAALVSAANAIDSSAAAAVDNAYTPPKKDPKGTDTPSGGGGGGGGGEKSNPYGDLWKSINEKLKMYTNIENVFKKLKGQKDKLEKALPQLRYKNSLVSDMRQAGLNEAMIAELMSKGYKDAKKVFEMLKKRNKLNIANRAMLAGNVGSATSDMAREAKLSAARAKATKLLEAQGVSKDVIESITQNDDIVEFFAKRKNMGSKMWADYVFWAEKAKKATDDVTESIDKQQEILDQANDMMDRQFDALERQTEEKYKNMKYDGMTVTQIQEKVQANEDLIRTYQDEIKAKQEIINDNQRLNDLDQQKIDDYNHEIDLQQRKIEGLQREDEMRNRAADAISRELELMARQEQEVRDAYQKRIESLDAVAKLNERILEAQQDQLNISKALSSGDVYAAAEAANQMQANQVRFASEQTRAGLEQGMESAVNGLTTASGMTREQAEAKIQAIRDQSYQTSLKVREIEDYIYNLKQTKILPLEDSIYARNLANRDLSNEIYLIEEDKIEPLTNQNDAYSRIIEKHDRQLALELATLEVAGFTKEAWDAKVKSLEAQISAAEDLSGPLKNIIGDYQAIAREAAAAAAEIIKLNQVAGKNVTSNIGTAAATGTSSGTMVGGVKIENPFNLVFATGGNVKKYASGSVVGDGARDSVSALLTPGEFVVRKAMVDKYGEAMFQQINQGSYSVPKYSAGGTSMTMPDVSRAGMNANINAPVYNSYSVNVNASTNASADDIARTVIAKIKTIESSNIRRINGY